MSKNHATSEGVTPKDARGTAPLDMNAVEMVFGTPTAPRTNFTPDVHTIANERGTDKDTVRFVYLLYSPT